MHQKSLKAFFHTPLQLFCDCRSGCTKWVKCPFPCLIGTNGFHVRQRLKESLLWGLCCCQNLQFKNCTLHLADYAKEWCSNVGFTIKYPPSTNDIIALWCCCCFCQLPNNNYLIPKSVRDWMVTLSHFSRIFFPLKLAISYEPFNKVYINFSCRAFDRHHWKSEKGDHPQNQPTCDIQDKLKHSSGSSNEGFMW